MAVIRVCSSASICVGREGVGSVGGEGVGGEGVGEEVLNRRTCMFSLQEGLGLPDWEYVF